MTKIRKRLCIALLILAFSAFLSPMFFTVQKPTEVYAATTRAGVSANWQEYSEWPTTSGYYYFTGLKGIFNDVTVASGVTITLDLSGYNFAFNEKHITVYGTLNIYDSSKNKTSLIKNGYSAGSGGAFYVSGGTLNLYGGTITTCKAKNYGGAIYATGSTANVKIAGGNIQDCQATGTEGGQGNGGAIGLANKAKFEMTSGNISGCTAKRYGGFVCLVGSSSASVTGGTITGCSCVNESGGAVDADGATFTLNGGTITSCSSSHLGGGVFVEGSGTFNFQSGTISSCTATQSTGGVYVEEGKFEMSGGTISNCSSGTEYHASGVYVRKDGTFIMKGGKIFECTSKRNGGGLAVIGKATISGGSFEKCTANNGGAIMVFEGGMATVSNCTFSNCTAVLSGGAFCVNSTGTLNFDSGTVNNCTASNSGGCAFLYGGVMNMKGGTISNCTATLNGGAISAENGGTFNMSAGTIDTCYANGTGGGQGLGAGVYVRTKGTFNMSGTALIQNCTAKRNGGAVEVWGSDTHFTMSGGTIYKCHATSAGGALSNSEGEVNVTGGTIQECDSAFGGGFYVEISTTSFSNCTIDGCVTTGNGGGIYTKTNVVLDNVTIKNCKSNGNSGAGLNVEGNYVVTVKNSLIDNCSATWGGAISIFNTATLNFENSTIKNCTAINNGQFIYNASTKACNLTGWSDVGYDISVLTGSMNITTNTHIWLDSEIDDEASTDNLDVAVYGDEMPIIAVPIKAGYTFNGYFDAENGGTMYYDENGTSEKIWDKIGLNHRLYSQWTPNPTFAGISLTLDSDIYINFYMELPFEALDNEDMVFTIGDKSIEAERKENKNGTYFTCSVNVLEIATTVKATYTFEEKDYELEYSVKAYVEKILNEKDGEGNFVYNDATRTLAYKISNYGYHTQKYLENIHKNVTIGEDGYTAMNYYTDYDIDLENAKSNLKDNFVTPVATSDYSLYGRTVSFDSASALNYYVKVLNGTELTADKVNCEGKEVEVKLYKNNIYIVTIKDIKTKELADNFTVTINGEESLTITGSILDYCGAIVNSHMSGTAEKDILAVNSMASIYEYHLAAIAYANSKK